MPRQAGLIRVAVGIIRRGGKVLVAERPLGKPYSGYWEFPGGKIEPDESGKEALRRELSEELGIDISDSKPWFEYTHAYPDKTVLLCMFLVDDFIGEPHGKENQQLRWVTFPEMEALRLLEGNWPIMSKMRELF